jgi:hypothetical protein
MIVKRHSSIVDDVGTLALIGATDGGNRAPNRGPAIGTLVGFARSGAARVTVGEGSAACLEARSCVTFEAADVGRRVVLIFEAGEPESPIVLGVLKSDVVPLNGEVESEVDASRVKKEVELDGKMVELTAQDTLTLRCGKASITLARDGKIVIRGMHVVTHAEGVNRIKGGSVQLN